MNTLVNYLKNGHNAPHKIKQNFVWFYAFKNIEKSSNNHRIKKNKLLHYVNKVYF